MNGMKNAARMMWVFDCCVSSHAQTPPEVTKP